jgi:hypothetical protein
LQLARHRIDAPVDGRPFDVYPIGDVHLGAAACDLKHFRRTVAQVTADPFAKWLGMGDQGDLIMPSDPRWSYSGHDWKNLGFINGRPDVKNLGVEHRDMIARELDPIASKCLGVHDGNHEDEMKKRYFVDVAGFLADRYKVPYLGYTALIRLDIVCRRGPKDHGRVWTIVIASEHGANGGGTDGNAANKLQTRGQDFDAEIYLKGHVHKRGALHRTALGWGAKKIATRDRLFVLTGTYLKGYTEFETTYGEKKGYAPNEIGGMVLRFYPKTQRVEAMNVEAAA